MNRKQKKELLRGMEAVELLALDSRESFQSSKHHYQARLEQEDLPALRELLRHLGGKGGVTLRIYARQVTAAEVMRHVPS